MTEIPGPEDRADDATVEAPATPDTTTEPADTTADTTELPTPGAPIEPTPTTPPPTGGGRKGVFVPLWSLLVVGGLVLFGIGFLAGHAVADEDHDDHFARDHRSEQERPDLPGGRTAPFGNGGNQAPDAAPGQGPRQVPGPQTGQGAFLGVAVTNGTDPAGAELLRVVAGSPADDAGLERGDVITEFDGKEIDARGCAQCRRRRTESGRIGRDLLLTRGRRSDGDGQARRPERRSRPRLRRTAVARTVRLPG